MVKKVLKMDNFDMVAKLGERDLTIEDQESRLKTAKKEAKGHTKSVKDLRAENESQKIMIDTLGADLHYETEKRSDACDSETVKKLETQLQEQKSKYADIMERLHTERSKKATAIINTTAQSKNERTYTDKISFLETKLKEKDTAIKNLTFQNNQTYHELDQRLLEIERRDTEIENLSEFIQKYVTSTADDTDAFNETGKVYFRDCLQKIKVGLTVGPSVTSGECDICYAPLANMPTETWKCNHVFCSVCTKQWRDKNPGGATCPTCRRREPDVKAYPKLTR